MEGLNKILFPYSHSWLNDKTCIITKWNFDFDEYEKLSDKLKTFVSQEKKYHFMIFCSHPRCFTMGRGNERGQDDLLPFDSNQLPKEHPIYFIKRGGGLTFHYPGQWIFYSIRSLSPRYNLDDHMCFLLKATNFCIKESFGIEETITAKKLMGIWRNKRKLASIGVGVDRFITSHGLALNVQKDDEFFKDIMKVAPCGLQPSIYLCLGEINSNISVEQFHEMFIKNALEKHLYL